MPHGVLFRGAAEGEIRGGHAEGGPRSRPSSGCPPNLFYGTGIPATILVLSKDKPKERRGKVLFVDASREYREGKAQNYLREEDVEKIARTFHAGKDVDKYARMVPLDEIEKADWNLNISQFIDSMDAVVADDLPASLAKLHALEEQRERADAKMAAALRLLGYV